MENTRKKTGKRLISFLFVMILMIGYGRMEIRANEAAAKATSLSKDSTAGDSSFEVHFIDVGQADAALVLCDGKAMLIDGGNAEDSSLIYSYLKSHSLKHLDYIVCTHAHEDHVGGLAGALNYASADHALCPVTSFDSKAFKSFVTCLKKQNVSITVPAAGDRFALGSASVRVLGPVTVNENDPNNSSIVLRIVYGNTSFLFTGDAEREEEQAILDSGCALKSTVLKVGHHGSDSSTTYPFLREIMPEYAVISVGKDNSYGHPDENTLSRLRDADVKVFRTDLQGDVICKSDGKSVTFTVERNADADTLAAAGSKRTDTRAEVKSGSAGAPSAAGSSSSGSKETAATDEKKAENTNVTEAQTTPTSAGTDYILNKNTHKFHYPSCSSVKQMKDKNKAYYTGTREEVIAMGYDPCNRCNP